jgi:hypothetical protein
MFKQFYVINNLNTHSSIYYLYNKIAIILTQPQPKYLILILHLTYKV